MEQQLILPVFSESWRICKVTVFYRLEYRVVHSLVNSVLLFSFDSVVNSVENTEHKKKAQQVLPTSGHLTQYIVSRPSHFSKRNISECSPCLVDVAVKQNRNPFGIRMSYKKVKFCQCFK